MRPFIFGSPCLIGLVLLLSCGGEERAPVSLNSGCLGAGCSDASAGQGDVVNEAIVEVGDTTETSDRVVDAYVGATGTLSGTVFISNLPEFPAEIGEQYSVYYPALVAIWANGMELTAPYSSTAGYRLLDVPVGRWPLVIRDHEEKNGIVDTVLMVDVPQGATSLDLPALSENAFVVIYGVQEPPILRNPNFAQVLMSFESCKEKGGQRLSGVRVALPSGAEGLLTHDGMEWKQGAKGTSSNGIAILTNVPTQAYPGATMVVSYTYGGQTYETDAFITVLGAVSRVVVVLC